MTGQLAFDLTAMIEEVNPLPPLPPYTGRAPLGFTVDYFTPAELLEARDYIKLAREREEWPWSTGHHAWGPSVIAADYELDNHDLTMLSADLRCSCLFNPPYGYDTRYCYCPGDLLTLIICERCAWHTIGTEAQAVIAWHDHAWPGWRDLPVVPKDVRPRGGGFAKSEKAANAWVAKHYATEWQVAGAPVITDRGDSGTRHVPGYSPWGGYDLAVESLGVEVAL